MSVVVITGCSSGFGLCSAVSFARNGDTVVATMRNLDKSEALEAAASAAGVEVALERLDVSDPISVADTFDRILRREGRVDILVNNAGISHDGSIEFLEDSDWTAVFETNLFGALRCIRAALPGMRERGSGMIINVSSAGARLPSIPIGAPYAASKCALGAVSESLALEVEPFGIRVRCIEPGPFNTAMTRNVIYVDKPDSPYADLQAAARHFFDQTLENGGDPQRVADAMIDAANDPEHWPVHRLVGDGAEGWLHAAASMSEQEWAAATMRSIGGG